MEEERKEKRTLILVVLLVIFVLGLAAGAGVYLYYNPLANQEDNTSDVVENTDEEELLLTSEQAYKLIIEKLNTYDCGGQCEVSNNALIYNDGTRVVVDSAKVLQKDDNNTYYIAYTFYQTYEDTSLSGFDHKRSFEIFHYIDGEWEGQLTFNSGIIFDDSNFVDVNCPTYYELSDELAFTLIELKRETLGYNQWVTGSASVIKKGDNDYYMVSYIEKNAEGYAAPLFTIFHLEKGEWIFEIPGASGYTDLSKYNFVDIKK